MRKHKAAARAAANPGGDFATAGTGAMLNAVGQIGRIQQRAFESALSRRTAALQAASPDPLAFGLLQARLLGEDVQAMVNWCGEMTEATLAAQVEFCACCAQAAAPQAVLDSAHLLD